MKRSKIVGSTDGTVAILQSDGSAASFVNGRWHSGIAFESRDFLEMSAISNTDLRTKFLEQAAEALAKSLQD
jgi:hypothetical protein